MEPTNDLKLKDILSVPPVKLVIELDDADQDPDTILSSFILTENVEKSLHALLAKIDSHKGCGVFVKGNYGSGKSHFLSYLYLLLAGRSHPVLESYSRINSSELMDVHKISLVKYPASYSLEDILLKNLGWERGTTLDREELYKKYVVRPMVLIIDELSEFLRSKPTPASFYEDIRFLQFLGEFSFNHPLWIIASLQEWIEETGHIASNIFNRIKDRYPLRLLLSSSHIEDIIDQRIVRKKEGSQDRIREVYDDLKRHFPCLNVEFSDFQKTFPLHPFTVRYLSGLAPIFSQHRGVIHFVFEEVTRSLDSAYNTLITPETIYDHFSERIREIPEISPFSRVVFDYYAGQIKTLFSQPIQQDMALAVLKVLILTEISPFEKRKTDREITEILLKRISTMASGVNYSYLKDGILEPLLAHQMYIRKEDDVYFIDAGVDEGIRIRAKIKSQKERFADRQLLFQKLCEIVYLPYLPLKDLSQGKKYVFHWLNSPRECVVLGNINVPLTDPEMQRILDGILRKLDGYFLVCSPFLDEKWFDALRERYMSAHLNALVAWIPRSPQEDEISFIEEFVARHELCGEFPGLRSELRRDESKLRELVTELYFQGRVRHASGTRVISMKDMGYLPLPKLLEHLFDWSLSEQHPDHHKIMARVDYISSQQLAQIFHEMIKRGRLSVDEAKNKMVESHIMGYLHPMGLVAKRKEQYVMTLEGENPLLSYALDIVSQQEPLSQIKQLFKKGRWGLSENQIYLLLSALIVSGQLIPYQQGFIIEFKDLNQLMTGEITHLAPGKTLSSDLLNYIPNGQFIWGETETVPTPATQRMMWKEIQQVVRSGRKRIEEIHTALQRYAQYSLADDLHVNTPLLNRMAMIFNAIGLSSPPSEGIEQFLTCLKETPDMKEELNYIERLHVFFYEYFQTINKWHLYLTHPSLVLPHDLQAKRDQFLMDLAGYKESFEGNFETLKGRWEEFYENFSQVYREAHEQYYLGDYFQVAEQTENLEEAKALKRIAKYTPSLTFELEWWDIKCKIDDVPKKCHITDLAFELFQNPVCSCGYQIGKQLDSIDIDLQGMCQQGIRNFLKSLHLPENREKIDSYLTGLKQTGKKDIARQLLKVVDAKVDETHASFILSLLNEQNLGHLEQALKGRWKTKILCLPDLVSSLKGRRFPPGKLKQILNDWVGDDERTIIHVQDLEQVDTQGLKQNFLKYGSEGKKVLLELEDGMENISLEQMENHLKDNGRLTILDSIPWNGYATDQLLDFLKNESVQYLRKNLRREILSRLKGTHWEWEIIHTAGDASLTHCLELQSLLRNVTQYHGIDIFRKIIAPAQLLLAQLNYENIQKEFFDSEILEAFQKDLDRMIKNYEKEEERFEDEQWLDLASVRDQISGPVVILDGLRYDLWIMLRDVLIQEGWKVNERTFGVRPPCHTAHFREEMGIGCDLTIDEKTYALFKWAERNTSIRNFQKFLKGTEVIKFVHFNFIDAKAHTSTLDLYPLFLTIKDEFQAGIIPILKQIGSFYLLADHGFSDQNKLPDRYAHGQGGLWETILPFVEVR